ncbi:MAG TPA: tetratricopeptide repeat protein [Puia sp.]|uniref:tetratricopeptide repeat protein n=1 Tax=Puia sp. TaxID=2045100 RepID=UPI002C555BCA|nr:tetratricopeptide repeat protein [Puia sp.]HVU96020.1 tetratricopeptide repeat protein [Puia sp.]
MTSLKSPFLLSSFLFFVFAASAQTAEEYVQQGLAKYNAGQYADAIALFNKAVALKRDDQAAIFNRGLAKYKIGDSTAEADFSRAIVLNPALAQAYVVRGQIFQDKKDYRGAFQDFDKAVQLKPDYFPGYLGRGNIRMLLKDYQGAIADEAKVISLDPKHPGAYLIKGTSQYAMLDYTAAIGTLDTCIGFNDAQYLGVAYRVRGLSEVHIGKQEAACKDFDRAIGAGYKKAAQDKADYCH